LVSSGSSATKRPEPVETSDSWIADRDVILLDPMLQPELDGRSCGDGEARRRHLGSPHHAHAALERIARARSTPTFESSSRPSTVN
jgi:hypothetical protein